MALPLATLLLLTSGAAAWSDTPSSLVAKYAGAAGSTVRSRNGGDKLKGYTAYWSIDATAKKIYVAVEAPSTGWVSFGISEAAGMRGADIMMGHVASDGKVFVGDYHATGNALPVKDGCQDWTVHLGEANAGSTLLVVSRLLVTEDSNDRPILLEGLTKTGLLFAYGDLGDEAKHDTDGHDHDHGRRQLTTHDYTYHGANRVKVFVDLGTGADAGQVAWSAAHKANAAMSFIDLKANEGVVPAGNPSESFRAPVAGGQAIPTTRTSYWEYCFTTSAAWDHTKSMVAFESVSDGSPANVHHFVLYGYSGANCQSGDSGEQVVWVGGIGFYEDLPAGVGIPFSRTKSFRLQIHYDNPTGAAGMKDNSGARVWLSSAALEHEAGTLQLGDGTVLLAQDLTDRVIPKGRSYYAFTCPAAETSKWPTDITVFASILHMHQQGDQMYTEVTDGASKVVKRPNAVEYFDFDWQDPTLVQPYVVKKGDTLTTRCYYNNKVGTDAKPLKFGLGSEEEMCIDFLYYYPYSADIKQHCTFGSGGHFGGSWDGKTAITDDADPGMRVFGTKVGLADDPTCKGGAVFEIPATTTPTSSSPSPAKTSTTTSPSPAKTPTSSSPSPAKTSQPPVADGRAPPTTTSPSPTKDFKLDSATRVGGGGTVTSLAISVAAMIWFGRL